MITPHPYQQDVIDGAKALWAKGRRRIAAVMATGGGKTVVFSFIIRLALAAKLPTLVIAHRTELIDQAIDKLRQINPDVRIGRMQGRRKEYLADIVVGSVQTCATPGGLALLQTRRWGLIVVDETHHAAAATYVRLLRGLGAYKDGGPLVLGVTATLGRHDGLALGDIFEDIIEPRVGLMDLIEQGYLVRPRGIRVQLADLDLSAVRRTAGDLNSGQLGAAMSASLAPQRIVEAWQEHAKGRQTIAFLPTVAVSIEQAEAFRAAGYRAVHLDGTTPDAERDATVVAYRRAEVDVLCNVDLFSEGTDLPMCSCVVLGRPTSSGEKYQQQVGRGLRLFPGKVDCVVLDFVGNAGRHKLATIASLGGADRPQDVPDELLMYEDELIAEEDIGGDGPPAPEYADGALEHELIDLFGESHSAWLRTPGGRWFISVLGGLIYLEPREPGRYDLCWHDNAKHRNGILQEDMEIGYAMAAGDAFVAARPIWQTERSAAWRDRPSNASRHAGGETRGQRHDREALIRATNALDKPAR